MFVSAVRFFSVTNVSRAVVETRRIAPLQLSVGSVPDELETDVLVDEPQQMVFRHMIFQTEVIEQRFGAVVLPHHDQQASEDRNAAMHVEVLNMSRSVQSRRTRQKAE